MNRTARATKALAVTSLFGAAALVAPAAHAADPTTSMKIALTGQVSGHTLDLQYQDEGMQYQVDDGSKALTRQGAMAFSINYGDGSKNAGYDGTGGLTCMTSGAVAPFSDSVSSGLEHKYKKAGTYTVTATGSYCGEGGLRTVTKKYTVTIAKDVPPAKVSATAHIDYVVNGMTATIVPSVSGTQHYMTNGKHKKLKIGVPTSFDMTLPAGATVSGGNVAGDIGEPVCTSKGSYEFDPVSLSGDPIVLTFKKPGTYAVTLKAGVCTDQKVVTKTVWITVPAGSKPTTPPTKPTHPTHPTTPGTHPTHPTMPGTHPTKPTGHPTHPGTPAPTHPGTPAPTTPGVGPKVETDHAGSGTQNLTVGLAGLAGLGALGGGVVAARRRTQG